jgi:hypothetical protein
VLWRLGEDELYLPQGATTLRRAARDSAFSLLELMELQHATEAAGARPGADPTFRVAIGCERRLIDPYPFVGNAGPLV